jgi:hypothetical protein
MGSSNNPRYEPGGSTYATSIWPIAPSHSPSSPSTSNNQLCNVLHVSQMLLAFLRPSILIPVFKILQRPFKMPKVHSTSLRSDLHQWLQQRSMWSTVILNGGMVVLHFRMPLSTINQGPLYFLAITLPFLSLSSNSYSRSGECFLHKFLLQRNLTRLQSCCFTDWGSRWWWRGCGNTELIHMSSHFCICQWLLSMEWVENSCTNANVFMTVATVNLWTYHRAFFQIIKSSTMS